MAKHDDAAQDKPMIKKIAGQEVKAHEKRMHKMAKGGKTNSQMRTLGRGLAKVANQKISSRGR
jgi:cytochrome c553